MDDVREQTARRVLYGVEIQYADCTQLETARVFGVMYRDLVRYMEDRERFCVYDGSRWIIDGRGNQRTHEIVQTFIETASRLFSNPEAEVYDKDKAKFFQGYDSRSKRDQLVKDIESQAVLRCTAKDFDKAKNLLNVKNGTLNLDTGKLEPHRADDLITMLADVEYDPKAKAPRFERFLSEIMQSNKELIDHLQEVLGYGLSGETNQERFFVFYGETTRNGKGTLNETILSIMGDYGRTAKYESFQESYYRNSGGAPSEDIARLQGARYVSVPEPSNTMIMDVAKVKTLTGGDTITARFLHQGSFDFKPQFKIFINTNHLPRITDDTIFSSDRVEVITFNRHFDDEERDTNLKAALQREKSGILNWLLAGYQRMKASGRLAMPASVKLANMQYKADNDKIGQFISDEMEKSQDSSVPAQHFYTRFKSWCGENGYKILGRNTVYHMLDERGLAKDIDHAKKVVGYRFTEDRMTNPFT